MLLFVKYFKQCLAPNKHYIMLAKLIYACCMCTYLYLVYVLLDVLYIDVHVYEYSNRDPGWHLQ